MRKSRVAVLDIGSNTIMLLLASCDKTGHIDILNEYGAVVNLGETLYSEKYLAEKTMLQAAELCYEIVQIAKSEGAEKIIVTVSSSLKLAINISEFLVLLQSKINIFPHMLTANEEKNHIFNGAMNDYTNIKGRPIILIEIGSSETFLIYGTEDIVVGSYNFDIGSYKALKHSRERSYMFFNNKSLTPLLKSVIKKPLKDVKRWLDAREPIILCSGSTPSIYASIASNKGNCTREYINSYKGSVKGLSTLYKELIKMSLEERFTIPGLEKERVETFPVNVFILNKMLKWLGYENFNVTTNGLRTGILKSFFENNERI